MNNFYSVALVVFSFFFVSCRQTPNSTTSARPNILFIMGDDHTTNAISAYGGIYTDYSQTVNIDRLAEEGIRFTHCFNTNAICSPSRATILTGKYSHKNGVYILGQEFDSTQVTSANVLQSHGYQTAVFGKWHLKSTPPGFNDYKVLQVQGRYKDPEFVEKGIDSLVIRKGWSTDIITDLTLDFIKNRDENKPFFVMTHYKATHDPWSSRPPYDTLFQNINLPEPGNLYDIYESRSDAARRSTLKLELINQATYPHDRLENAGWREQRGYIFQQYIKDFLRCGRVLDENVGRLLNFLDQEGLRDNTIVIYTADQGHFLGEHGFFSKRFMYDEAMKMPLIIRYPGKVNSGTVNDDLIVNIDFAPTIIDLAGISIPMDMQGRSILPILSGVTPEDWRTGVYYHYWQHLLHRDVTAHYGIRTKKYKLIFYYGLPLGKTDYPPVQPEWELFDLQKDPNEMVNVYSNPEYSETVESLKIKLWELKREFNDTDDQYPELIKVRDMVK